MPCRPAISSMSLGRAWEHALFTKLGEASKAGFKGVEIFYEDLDYLASTHGEPSRDNLRKAATDIRIWCDNYKLDIVCLQPFMFYEGLVDRDEHGKRIEKFGLWLELVKILRTDMILLPSNFGPKDELSDDLDLIARDLAEVADLAAKESPPVRIAYENLAWGTHINTWEQVWNLVKRVDKENFGMCIDTFNIVGGIWAEPTILEGKVPNADEILESSVQRLAKEVNVKKIFFAQIIDGEMMREPLIEGHPWYDKDQSARMSWSRNARAFAYENGYLPIEKVMDVLFNDLKFEGWVSMELFSRTMADPDEHVPESHAERGIASWHKMKERYTIG